MWSQREPRGGRGINSSPRSTAQPRSLGSIQGGSGLSLQPRDCEILFPPCPSPVICSRCLLEAAFNHSHTSAPYHLASSSASAPKAYLCSGGTWFAILNITESTVISHPLSFFFFLFALSVLSFPSPLPLYKFIAETCHSCIKDVLYNRACSSFHENLFPYTWTNNFKDSNAYKVNKPEHHLVTQPWWNLQIEAAVAALIYAHFKTPWTSKPNKRLPSSEQSRCGAGGTRRASSAILRTFRLRQEGLDWDDGTVPVIDQSNPGPLRLLPQRKEGGKPGAIECLTPAKGFLLTLHTSVHLIFGFHTWRR